MHLAGHVYPGHTELLAELAGGVPVRMMLANPELRTVLVTIHMSLASRRWMRLYRNSRFVDTLRITDAKSAAATVLRPPGAKAARPCIAVAGLNPHAGEGGIVWSRRNRALIAPAIAAVRALKALNARRTVCSRHRVHARQRGLKPNSMP